MIKKSTTTFVVTLAVVVFMFGVWSSQSFAGNTTSTYHPVYLPVNELLSFLGLQTTGGQFAFTWGIPNSDRAVSVQSNPNANLLLLSGDSADVALLEKMMSATDVAPQQIEIQVQIVEISRNKSSDIGVDWASMFDRISLSGSANWVEQHTSDTRSMGATQVATNMNIIGAMSALDKSGAGTVRNAPRVLTMNNRTATILDGTRLKYVSRYSSYANMYVTDSLDAGLTLRVTPSVTESGFVTMRVAAELTSLNATDYSGDQSKSGQMIENTVIVKDGESVLLGGSSQVVKSKQTKRFPLLGWVIPFLFSRHVTIDDQIDRYIVLTPRTIVLGSGLDQQTSDAVEGK